MYPTIGAKITKTLDTLQMFPDVVSDADTTLAKRRPTSAPALAMGNRRPESLLQLLARNNTLESY